MIDKKKASIFIGVLVVVAVAAIVITSYSIHYTKLYDPRLFYIKERVAS